MSVPTLVALVDGDLVRAPAPGWFRRGVEPDHLVAPGDPIGELDVLGRIARVLAPRVRGIVRLVATEPRRAVGYGDVLFRVDADVAVTPTETEPAATAPAETGFVFRAPTSGRFYGRPAPDKPAFVTPGAELHPGTTVCLLEVMKTFHRVAYTGEPARVLALLVADGADVNAGDPLLSLGTVATYSTCDS